MSLTAPIRLRVVPRLIPTDGKDGPPNVLAIGTVQGGETAAASITGSSPSQVLNLVLPKGDKGDKGDTGDTGPKGDKGDQGIPGTDGANGNDGAAGADGDDGWTPIFSVVADGDRYVQQVSDWTGGSGSKPVTGQYVGPSGFVSVIANAVNIRGASGSGTGDMLASVYDPANKAGDAFAMDNMVEGTDTKIMTAAERSKISALGTAADANIGDFATAAQGAKADTAVQPDALATVATSGSYNDLSDKPAIPAGTVTSVGLSAPTGFTVSDSPVTGAGTLTFDYASGYTGFTTTLQTKLNGIEAGATANQSDAYLLDRANHTGVMPFSALESVASGGRVLGRTSGTGWSEVPLSSSATANSLAYRGEGGGLQVGTPTVDAHATTKLYVDTGLAGAETLGEQAGINTQTGTAYTLALSDKGKVVEMNNGAANTLTIPTNANVAFPVNTRIDVVQFGTGQTTIAGDTGVVIYSADGNTKLNKQYSGATLYKRSTNGWVLVGDLVA